MRESRLIHGTPLIELLRNRDKSLQQSSQKKETRFTERPDKATGALAKDAEVTSSRNLRKKPPVVWQCCHEAYDGGGPRGIAASREAAMAWLTDKRAEVMKDAGREMQDDALPSEIREVPSGGALFSTPYDTWSIYPVEPFTQWPQPPQEF